MTSEDTEDLPFNAEIVLRCRTAAIDAIMTYIIAEQGGDLSYTDAVYTGAAVAAQLCATANSLEGVRAGVDAVTETITSGGFLSTAIAYHHSLRASIGEPVKLEEYDA